MKRIQINDHIVADPAICHGKPTFTGTRIMVWQVLEMLAVGQSVKEIIGDFPQLSKEHIRAALEYAGSITKESYAIISTQP